MVKIVEAGGSSGDQASDAMDDGSSSNQILVTGVGMHRRAAIERFLTSCVRITVMRYGITRDLRLRHIGNLVTRTAPNLYPSWKSMAISIFRFWVSDVSQVANTNPTWRAFCQERIYRRPESQMTPAYCWPGGVPAFGRFHPTYAPGLAFDNLSWESYGYEEVRGLIDTMIVIEPFMVVTQP